MGKADERRSHSAEFHFFEIDRDLEDGDRKFQELREHFDTEIGDLKARVSNLTKVAGGVLVSLTITAITLLLNLAKP